MMRYFLHFSPKHVSKKQTPQQENQFVNLGFNIIAPTLILVYLSKEEYLGPLWGLIIALSFPIGYGFYDLIKTKKVNAFSVLGLVSTLLTGIMGIFHFPPEWIAIKEAFIPFVIGSLVLLSRFTPFSLVSLLLFTAFSEEVISRAFAKKKKKKEFHRVIQKVSYIIASSFFLSAVLNYFLAIYIVKSEPGTEAFNSELGSMMAFSYPVIVFPTLIVFGFALYYFVTQIQKYTSLKIEEMMLHPLEKN